MEKEEIVEAVLGMMAEGKTVKEATVALKVGMTAGTVRRWMAEREDWFGRYQQMKKLLAAALAEEAIQVARETTNHSSAADRLLIETLKWAAAKANPAEYGERQTVEHQGAPVLQVKIVEDEAPHRQAQSLNPAQQEAVSAGIIAAQTLLLATPVSATVSPDWEHAPENQTLDD